MSIEDRAAYKQGHEDGIKRERADVVSFLRRIGLPEKAKMVERGDHLP